MKIKLPKFLLKPGTVIKISPTEIKPMETIEKEFKKKTSFALIESLGDADPFNTLKDENELVRKYACEALGNIGRPAVPALLLALRDEKVRAHAAQAMLKIK